MLDQVAFTIWQQLGGSKFDTMTGAYCKRTDTNMFCTKFKGCPKCNFVKIALNGSDLYDVTFYKVRGCDIKIISEHKDIFNDMLIPLFEQETKLYLSL